MKRQLVIAVVKAANGNAKPLLNLALPTIVKTIGVTTSIGILFSGTALGAAVVAGGLFGQQAVNLNGTQSCTNQTVVTGVITQDVPALYRPIFTQAAAARGTDVNLLATVFYVEHGRSYPEPPPPYGKGKAWAVSSAAAMGPFQFIPSTWQSFGVDGNKDGKIDPNDLTDAAYSAANYLSSLGGKAGIPPGNPAKPYDKPSIVNVMASYNAGPAGNFGNGETQAYIKNGFAYYTKLTNGPLANPLADTTISECTTTFDSLGTTASPKVFAYGSTMLAGISAGGLGTNLAAQSVQLNVSASPGMTLDEAAQGLPNLAPKLVDAKAIVLSFGDAAIDGTGAAYVAKVKSIVAKVRVINPTANIWWVDANTRTPDASLDPLLTTAAEAGGFKLVYWKRLARLSATSGGPSWTTDGSSMQLSGSGDLKVAALVGQFVMGDLTVADKAYVLSGNAKDLAQQVLVSPQINLFGRLVRQDVTLTSQGKPGSSGAPLSANMLAILLELAKTRHIIITAIESGGTGHAAGSNHYEGRGMDVDIGPAGNAAIAAQLYSHRADLGIGDLIYSPMPAGTTTLKYGSALVYNSATMSEHTDHVHFSSNK